jgi:hypothetical protein
LLGVATIVTGTAQDATPIASPGASPAASPAAGAGPEFLFVQVFAEGTWTPKPDDDGVYLLTLTGHTAQTIYFSDRPERIVGTLPTREFLDRLGFTPTDSPNAAVVAQTADGGEAVLVVELFDPLYAEDTGDGGGVSVTYTARVLDGEPGERLSPLAARQGNAQLPEAFGPASLFVDGPTSCSDGQVLCVIVTDYGNGNRVVSEKGRIGPMDFHWKLGDGCCHPSNTDQGYWLNRCNGEIAACGGKCNTVDWTPCW